MTGRAAFAERELAVELPDKRDLANRRQTIASRQGETIESTDPLHERHAEPIKALDLARAGVPAGLGAIRTLPDSVELCGSKHPTAATIGLYKQTPGGQRWRLLAP